MLFKLLQLLLCLFSVISVLYLSVHCYSGWKVWAPSPALISWLQKFWTWWPHVLLHRSQFTLLQQKSQKKGFSAVLGGLGFCYFIKLDSSSNSAFCSVLDNSGTSSGRKCQHCSSLTPHRRVLTLSEGPGSRATAWERAKADHVAIRKLSSFSLSPCCFLNVHFYCTLQTEKSAIRQCWVFL